jgi:hypothetical protein
MGAHDNLIIRRMVDVPDMPRFRFSLLALFGCVTVAAIACAALINPTKAWCSGVITSVFVLLFFAVLSVIYGSEQRRAFWVGFAVVGWGYILMHAFLGHLQIAGYLATSQLLTMTVGIEPELSPYSNLVDPEAAEHVLERMAIGHALWMLALGFVGGIVARYLYLRREAIMRKT